MDKYTLSVKIDGKTADRMKKFCREHGMKYGFFVEKSLEEKLSAEELKEDILDMNRLKNEELSAVSLADYVKTRNV
ncbi:MAG TPA: hypothetical protein PKN36_04130 [bacterium]|nr:hypothetical protein [bacterium]